MKIVVDNRSIWTEILEPSIDVPYNHVKADSPVGEFIITWKGWKEDPSYDVELNDIWLGSAFDLDDAKEFVKNYLLETSNQLNGFVKMKLN